MSRIDVQHREIPLFPLETVLFSGGRLPLRIFEPRYLDMIGHCLKLDMGFGVVLVRQPREPGAPAGEDLPPIFDIGTYAHVVDFDALEHGVLGVVCHGETKFRVHDTRTQRDGLLLGQVEMLPEERAQALASEHQPLIDVLRELLKHPTVARLDLSVNFSDARSVSWRLAELLPLEPEIKQGLLQMSLPRERLTELARLVHHLRS